MVDRVLDALWHLTIATNISEETLNETILNMEKIIEHGSLTAREKRRVSWLERIIKDLKNNHEMATNTIAIIKLFERIGNLLAEPQREDYEFDRKTVLSRLETEQNLISYIAVDLINFRAAPKNDIEKEKHFIGMKLRLQFIKYILTEAQLYFCYNDAEKIWDDLVSSPDLRERELGFHWFRHLMGEESDMDAESILSFFMDKILHLETSTLSQPAIDCFSAFFTHIIHQGNKEKSKSSENKIIV